MPSPAGTIAWKFANALIPDAAPSERVLALDRLWGVAALRRTLERFKSTHGGLWVGGAVYVTADSLSFEPNAVNIKAHSNDVSWSLPLRSIDGVQDNFGYVTRIVELKLKDGLLSRARACRAPTACLLRLAKPISARASDAHSA